MIKLSDALSKHCESPFLMRTFDSDKEVNIPPNAICTSIAFECLDHVRKYIYSALGFTSVDVGL